jgi:hypothetical protein
MRVLVIGQAFYWPGFASAVALGVNGPWIVLVAVLWGCFSGIAAGLMVPLR